MSVLSQIQQKYSSLNNYPTAIYRVTVNDVDISSHLASRLMSMTIQDNRGMVADSVDITLDDSDNALEIPEIFAELKVWLGWSDTGLVYKGSYKVTQVSHSGTPDQMSISAEAEDLAEGFRQKREKSWDMVTIQDIIEYIARQYALLPVIHESLIDQEIAHIDQNESDANLITRLADEYDAIATVKNGHLLFMPRGMSETASGLKLDIITIQRSAGDSHNFTSGGGTDRIDGVKTFYYDKDKAVKKFVIVGQNDEGNIKEIRYTCRDKASAELAANAEFIRCKRSAKSFSINLAKGNPTIIPEQQIIVQGFKTQIDEVVWLGTTITHNLDESNGYTTSIQCEVQLPDADNISTLFDGSIEKKEIDYAAYTGVKAVYKDTKKQNQTITLGDQAKPLILEYPYGSKNAAETAVYREYNRILSSQDKPAIEKPKAVKTTKKMPTRQEKLAKRKKKLAQYTGVQATYLDQNKKEQVITKGSQSFPLVKYQLYTSRKLAEAAIHKAYKEIQASK